MANTDPIPPKNTSKSDPKTLLSRIQARQGMARNNRFYVDFSAVSSLLKVDNVQLDDLNYFCESSSIPGRTIETVNYGLWHRDIKLPTGYINDDVTMTFHMTNDYFIKKLLDLWMGKIINVDSYLLNYDKDYKTSIKLYQLNQMDKIVYGVELIDAYPYTLKALDLNNGNENEIVSCSASFTYKDYRVLPITSADIPAALNSVPTSTQSTPANNPFYQTVTPATSGLTPLPPANNPFYQTVTPATSGLTPQPSDQPSILDTLNPSFLEPRVAPPITPPTTPDYKPIIPQPSV